MAFLQFLLILVLGILLAIYIKDRLLQQQNVLIGNFPIFGRLRYFFHALRPFFRQYFGDDNAFVNRIIIDWIIDVSNGKSGYFAYDKFDTTSKLHDGLHQMIHSNNPMNDEEMEPQFPVVGKKRKHPMHFHSYLYRSAMSLGSLSFEATTAMAAACADTKAAFNTGEGGLSVHHIPRVAFSYDKKFFKYIKLPIFTKWIYKLLFVANFRVCYLNMLASLFCGSKLKDTYLLDKKHWVFYTIDWDAPLDDFPKASDLTEDFGHIILQIGSALYGLRKDTEDGQCTIDWERFKKVTSFCRAIEIKLAQGAKQTGGILKANKNTHAIAHIRGITPEKDLESPNRFPFYNKGKEKEFFTFIEKLSKESGNKPVGVKIVISDESNIEGIAKQIVKDPKKGPDFITIDGGDGGTGAAPIALGVLFGKKIYDALGIADKVLKKHKVRKHVSVFASSKLYAPHMSAKALAMGADAIGNARSIMISGGCIRAGVCSGEKGHCPVGMATMHAKTRRIYAQAMDSKITQIGNYIKAHNKGIVQVAAVAGVTSPSLLTAKHIAKPRVPII